MSFDVKNPKGLVTQDGKIKFTVAELDYLQSYLDRGDRCGYYIAVYNMTGDTQALEQAQVASFSEGLGGTAFFANIMLQTKLAVGQYPGLYYISQKVAEESLISTRDKLNSNTASSNYETGYISNEEMFSSAATAWRKLGREQFFPGNLLGSELVNWLSDDLHLPDVVPSTDLTIEKIVEAYNALVRDGNLNSVEFTNRLISDGALAAVVGVLGGPVMGKRLSDYSSLPLLYEIQDLPDSTYSIAINRENKKVVGVFSNAFLPITLTDFFNKISSNWPSLLATIPGGIVAGVTAAAVTSFLNSYLDEFHRSLSEGHSGFNGDINPQNTNSFTGSTDYLISESPTPGNDTRWGTGGAISFLYGDVLYGGGGNDRMFGGDGGDELHGGVGKDIIYGQTGNDALFGDEEDDLLRGGQGADTLNGGSGNDTLDGSDVTPTDDNAADELNGGAGNDLLSGGGGADTLDGGEGTDTLIGGNGFDTYLVTGNRATIIDSDASGSVELGTELLSLAKLASPGVWRSLSGNMTFFKLELPSIRGKLFVGGPTGSVEIQDFKNGDLGIRLQEDGDGIDWDDLFDRSRAAAAQQPASPLVLDLDGNGIHSIDKSAGIHFDLDSNRFAETVGWVSATDGLLARDLNENGSIDDGGELFGNYTTRNNGRSAANGFQALSELDSNGDGVINAADLDFNSLLVWRDANSNGVSDSGELLGLAAAGISQISTSYWRDDHFDESGNEHRQIGSFLRTDGIQGSVADVWFDVDSRMSIELDVLPIPADIADLPDLPGNGNVRSLQQAIVRDGTGHLQSLVELYLAEKNQASRLAIVIDLIYAWAGVEDVDPLSRSFPFSGSAPIFPNNAIGDSRKLAALEAFMGEHWTWDAYPGRPLNDPGDEPSYLLQQAFDSLVNYYDKLLTATELKPVINAIDASWNEATSQFDIEAAGVADLLRTEFQKNSIAGLELLGRAARHFGQLGVVGAEIIEDLRSIGSGGADRFSQILSSISGDIATVVAVSGAQVVQSGLESNILVGSEGNDEFFLSTGLDIVAGGAGNDTTVTGGGTAIYLFDRDCGRDRVISCGGQLAIYTADDISASEVLIRREINSLVLSIRGTEDSVRFEGFFSSDPSVFLPLSITLNFSGGESWNNDRLIAESLLGTNNADVIVGTSSNDVIDGLVGDDQLFGAEGDDTLTGGGGEDVLSGGSGRNTYVINSGDGNDAISLSTDETAEISFGSGVLPENVAYWRDANDLLHIEASYTSGSVSSLVVSGYQWSLQPSALTLSFSNGASVSGATLAAAPLLGTVIGDVLAAPSDAAVLKGLTGNDTLVASQSGTTLIGGLDDDELWGGSGNDVFIFTRGDGHDVLMESELTGNDVLRFGPGIGLSEVTLRRNESGDLVLEVIGSADSFVIKNYFDNLRANPLEVEFANGDRLNTAALWQAAFLNTASGSWNTGSNGADAISVGSGMGAYGDAGADTITGSAGADVLYGGIGDDSLVGAAGDDVLRGGEGADLLWGGVGADALYGGTGNDTYTFSRGDGIDLIVESDATLGNVDTIKFDNTILPADVSLWRDTNSALHIDIAGGADSIIVSDFFAGTANRVERIEFSNGVVWTDLLQRGNTLLNGTELSEGIAGDASSQKILGLGGNDNLSGGAGNDTLVGGAGNDYLEGGDGSDLYLFSRGDGHDIINPTSSTTTSVDVIRFGPGIHAADVTVALGENGTVVLKLDGGSDSVTIESFEEFSTHGLQRIEFDDGDVWLDLQQRAAALVLTGTTGDDVLTAGPQSRLISGLGGSDELTGGSGSDTLVGGAGNDTLDGQGGNDVYVFNLGDGYDSIEDTGTGDVDTIRFGAEISASDISIHTDAQGNALLEVAQGGGITIACSPFTETLVVQRVEFANGDVWTNLAERAAALVAGTTDGDFISSGGWNSRIEGLSGDDYVSAGAGNDTLVGGIGNDHLFGEDGSDLYIFNRGDGRDVIADSGSASDVDVIRFGASIVPGDVTLYRGADNALHIELSGGTDQIVVSGFYASPTNQIERIEFSNGTVWSDLASRGGKTVIGSEYVSQIVIDTPWNSEIFGSDGDENIQAGAGNDTIHGGKGIDALDGGGGGDLYIFNRGDGNDTLYDSGLSGSDVLRFGPGITAADLSVEVANNGASILGARYTVHDGGGSITLGNIDQIERIEFFDGTQLTTLNDNVITGTEYADLKIGVDGNDSMLGLGGVDYLIGNDGADTLVGGKGDDFFDGGLGDDVYLYDFGDGFDGLQDLGGTDRIVFSSGIAPEDVEAWRDLAGNLQLSIDGHRNEGITVYGFFLNTRNEIESIEFADGTHWSAATLRGLPAQATSGDDYFVGNASGSRIDALGGNDTLVGQDSDDTLVGGSGNDFLQGGDGSDVYLFRPREGDDVIADYGPSGIDVVRFAEGIRPTDVVVWRDIQGTLHLDVGAGSSSVSISDFFSSSTQQEIERVEFADSTVWDSDYLHAAHFIGTSESDSMTGSGRANWIDGGAGDDTISGDAGNDTLTGGLGDDVLMGGAGNDVYLFNRGDGQDTILKADYTAGDLDVIRFGTGISPADVSLTRDLDGALHLAIANTSDKITIPGFFSDLDYPVTAVEFVNGESWGLSMLQSAGLLGTDSSEALYGGIGNDRIDGLGGDDNLFGDAGDDSLSGGSGNDTISGGDGKDTLTGGTGDDALSGELGNDVYVFNRGDGHDSIVEGDGTLGNIDTIRFGAGINLTDVSLWRDANSLHLRVAGADDEILVSGFFDSAEAEIERVEFADGSSWNVTTLRAAKFMGTEGADSIVGSLGNDVMEGLGGDDYISGDAGNDSLNGGSGNDSLSGDDGADTLEGAQGNDSLTGGAGNDLYVFNRGDGQDTITETSGTDIVRFDSSITQANVMVSRDDYNYYFNVLGTSDRITVTDWFSAAANRVEKLEFGDGTSWDSTTLNNKTTTASVYADFFWGTASANTYNGLAGDDQIFGFGGNDNLTGGSGNDFIDGGIGNDVMIGGTGNDTFVVDSATDTLTEAAGEGTDTVQTTVSYTLSANVENLVLLDVAGPINGTGNAADNIILGNTYDNVLIGGGGNDQLSGDAGNDQLDGGLGADTLVGGVGDDLYIVDNVGDVVNEALGEGYDAVQATVTYALGANVEQLVLTGNSAIDGVGNALDNALTGNAAVNTLSGGQGNDTLSGGGGADTLIGGVGDDSYIIDDVGVVITELASEGIDTVNSSISYALGSALENLTLTGGNDITATGNSADNVLVGNTGNNTLTGLGGNDRLDGGGGSDSLVGGTGNDTYVVDDLSDVVTEALNEGTDTIESMVALTLAANVENLTLLEAAGAINGTGNALANVILGNSAINTLNGGAGADTLAGGAGDDIYVVDSLDSVMENIAEGIDTVQAGFSYTLAANVEKLTLTGTSAINGTGNSQDNTLTGNTAGNVLTGMDGNDTLDGKAGADTMVGGMGDDVYVVDNAGDVITESATEGIDTVQSSITYTLGANVEKLTLTGTTAINGTGNTLDNTLIGTSGINVLTGLAGNDVLDGKAGADTMIGGSGDDTYVVDNAGDVITENASEGTDTVQSSIAYSLGANLENLTLTGSAAISGTGNALNNSLVGNSGANTLTGAAGDDTLNGGTGADTLIGGVGSDTYVVDNVGDVVTENAGEGTDTVQSSITYTLGSNVENLSLAGTAAINGTGNALSNSLIGNSGANTLDGGVGADSMSGGAGNDTYIVDDAGDSITENANEGTDTVKTGMTYSLGTNLENLTLTGSSAVNATGNSLANVLTGNTAANTLDGGVGIDTMIGGAGDDIYIVDDSNDVVTELASQGTDTVQSSAATYTLSSNVENLVLTGAAAINGTGNTLANALTGNAANNTLDGGTGADSLVGGAGDDIYVVDNAGDVVTENASEGVDTVQSRVTWTLGSNVENLTLTAASAINGTGNTLDNVLTGNSAANTLTGGSGNDTLDGTAGTDSLVGGIGDDTYRLGLGYGADTVSENDSTSGNTDILSFGADIAIDQIWLRHVGNNLELSIIGTSDKATISNWYLGSQYHVEQFKTVDGKTLLDSQVANLVSAMAAFAPPSAGQTSLPADYQTALAPVIAANWQ